MGHTPGGFLPSRPGLLSMESLGNIMNIEGFIALVGVRGKTVTLLTDASTFDVLLQDEAVIDPGLMLGADPRESSRMQTLREWVPAALLKQDAESQAPASIDGVRVAVTKRVDNPGNPFVTFEFVKV